MCKITTTIDGVDVEGLVTLRTEWDIDVAIQKPYQNITGGSHIPVFSRPHSSFKGTHGDEVVTSILIEIYEIGKYIDQNMETLKSKLAEYENEIRQLNAEFDPEENTKTRRELKAQFRQNLIDNKTFQEKLIALRKQASEYDLNVFWASNDFFEKISRCAFLLGRRMKC